MYIINSDKEKTPALLLAPISVLIDYRGRSVGGSLIKEGFRIAREMGYKSVFLCGDPEYYHKFGFRTASDFNIKHTSDLEDKYVMCCELEDGSLKNINGIIDVV
jgi:putative acetyltransferase